MIAVAAGQAATHNFDLSTGIYQLDVFKVTGEREGGAAAITAQRIADNVKNIAAADSFGNLPNLNAGEVAIRLPGVYGELDGGGNLSGFTVRGMQSGANAVTMDGALLTGQGGQGRSIFPNTFSATMFAEIEVIKGHTPDKGAESLGIGADPADVYAADSAHRRAPHARARHARLPGGVRCLRRRSEPRRFAQPLQQRGGARLVHLDA
jgi:outer membrane receptor protein involved in Fe transport